jgi:hypothetical protein
MAGRDVRGGVRRGIRTAARSRGPLGWATAVAAGGAWWWAGLRLLAHPDRSSPVEGLVALGGWGLSLLPVHCVPWTRSRDRSPLRRMYAVWRGWGG